MQPLGGPTSSRTSSKSTATGHTISPSTATHRTLLHRCHSICCVICNLRYITLMLGLFYISIFMLIKLQSTCILLDVEVEAKSFVPKFGHLGQREPVVQPATEGKRIKQHV